MPKKVILPLMGNLLPEYFRKVVESVNLQLVSFQNKNTCALGLILVTHKRNKQKKKQIKPFQM